jgi:hypothetical protein
LVVPNPETLLGTEAGVLKVGKGTAIFGIFFFEGKMTGKKIFVFVFEHAD